MSDAKKTAEELIAENETLRQRVSELEATASGSDIGSGPWTPGDIRWHSLVANAPLLILVLDRELCVRFANHTDSGADIEQVVGKSIYAFCRPENESKVREYVERVFQTGEAVLCELPVMRLDGQEHWFVSHIGPIFQAGRVVAVSVISSNVTARRQAEEDRRQTQNWLEQRVRERTAELTKEVEQRRKAEQAMRRSEAKYRALVESSPDAVAMMDLEGRIVFASEEAAQLHSVAHADELIGREAAKLVIESERDLFRTNACRLIQEGIRRNDRYTGRRDDGSTFDAEMSSAVIRDVAGNPEALMAVYRDISVRIQAEERLATLGRFVEAASQGFGISELDGRITYMNAAMARLIGEKRPEDGYGKNCSTYYTNDVFRKRDEVIVPALARDGHWQGELPLLRCDGTVIPTLHSVFPVQDKTGAIRYLAVVITDITEIKQAEEKLRREQWALRRMVMASDHERRLITYELHDGVAQQLLGALMALELEELRNGLRPKAESGSPDGIDALRHASMELRRVMNWLRTPVLERFGIAEAIDDMATRMRLAAGAPEIQYDHAVQFRRLEPTLENSLFRIAQEAMTNAERHSKSRKIHVQLTQTGGEVTLEVRDWGSGFDPQKVAENRFGLEGIRERSRILGGKLEITSSPGQGTLVCVKFPVIEAASEG